MHEAPTLEQLYYETIRDLTRAAQNEPEQVNRLVARVRLFEELMTRLRREESKIGAFVA